MLYFINKSMDSPKPDKFSDAQMRYCWDSKGGQHHYWVVSCGSRDQLEELHKKAGYSSFTAQHEESMREELGKMGLQLK
jgi:hypothetical protein